MTAGLVANADVTSTAKRRAPKLFLDASIVFGVVVAACLAGILLRPPGLLSSLWIANAVLLGVLLRFPSLLTFYSCVAAVAGYVTADLLTGSSLAKALLLTAGNLAGVIVAISLFRRFGFDDVRLRRPHSLGLILVVTLAASIASGFVGVIVNPILFNRGGAEGFAFWMVTEFTNYIAILPLVLVFPGLTDLLRRSSSSAETGSIFARGIPLFVCIALFVAATSVGGVSSLAIPVPGLMWCALAYGVSTTSFLSFAFAVWVLVLPAFGVIPGPEAGASQHDLIGLRFGVSLVALTPILIASVMRAREEALREAAEARAATEEAMAARSLLLATMAHELRTPLNAIVGLSSVLEMDPPHGVSTPEHREFVNHIRQGGLHLAELVTDLLDTAKVEAGQLDLAMKQIGSRATIEQSMRLVSGLAVQAKVRIDLTGDIWPDVIADSRAIKQVMINVLSNAIKFSPPGSVVVIAARQDGARFRLSVTDSGPGISAADVERLGRPYVQTAAGKSQKQSTGLGLALSMDLIRSHGGQLRLHSQPGDGTTVTFDLALA